MLTASVSVHMYCVATICSEITSEAIIGLQVPLVLQGYLHSSEVIHAHQGTLYQEWQCSLGIQLKLVADKLV